MLGEEQTYTRQQLHGKLPQTEFWLWWKPEFLKTASVVQYGSAFSAKLVLGPYRIESVLLANTAWADADSRAEMRMCIPVEAQAPCRSIGVAISVQLPTSSSLLLLTQLFREGESISNQPYGMEFYLPWRKFDPENQILRNVRYEVILADLI
ncbi:hypothetical protein MJT46_013375 [Ovis ammon polii x Ovis aries]|nr:hypothetical protein MJT46_013375 [Ovis ammon polii x Ovis aries]